MKLLNFLLVFAALSVGSYAQTERDNGIELFRTGEYAKAIDVFERLRKDGSLDYASASYLGACYVKTDETKKAIDIFNNLPVPKPGTAPMVYDKKIKITKKPQARLDGDLVRTEGSGKVRLAVELRHDGQIGFIFPFATTSKKLTEAATEAAKGVRFEPAIQGGKQVTVVLVFDYNFST